MNDLSGDDPLWPHFGPLWTDLHAHGTQSILIAGGYGLFLKQRFLLANPAIPVVVPLDRWPNASPRVTKDLDLVVGLNLIADENSQKEIVSVLIQHGFSVTEKNPRWQFEKRLSASHAVIVDLHAPSPPPDQLYVQTDRFRVKHKPSLGEDGIHGRVNREAVGCNLHPFRFEANETSMMVPNSVTWSMMKLTAMRDRWNLSHDATQSEELRQFNRQQAIKHAQDVCRVVALVTREESDTIPSIVEAIRTTPEFSIASLIGTSLPFGDPRLTVHISAGWDPNDFSLIRTTLSKWFS